MQIQYLIYYNKRFIFNYKLLIGFKLFSKKE